MITIEIDKNKVQRSQYEKNVGGAIWAERLNYLR